jgi:hypothetical protein
MTTLDTAVGDARDRLRRTVLRMAEILVGPAERVSAEKVLAVTAPLAQWGEQATDLRDIGLRTEAMERHFTHVRSARLRDFTYLQTPEQCLTEVGKLHAYLAR